MRNWTGNMWRLAIGLALMGLSGCGFSFWRPTAEITNLETGSPLRAVAPKVFCVEKVTDPKTPTSNLGTTVAEALKRELIRNGQKCVATKEPGVDFVISGTILGCGVGINHYALSSKIEANAALDMVVTSQRTPQRVFKKTYRGESYMSGVFLVPEGRKMSDCRDEALLNVVKEFSTDPEVIDFLKAGDQR